MTDLSYVKRPPRGLAHDLTVGGCPGFSGGEHTNECDNLTQALVDYGRWREQKGQESALTRIEELEKLVVAMRAVLQGISDGDADYDVRAKDALDLTPADLRGMRLVKNVEFTSETDRPDVPITTPTSHHD